MEAIEQRLLLSRPTGFDVSSNQGTISQAGWNTAFASGRTFTYIRAGTGRTPLDGQMHAYSTDAIAAGFKVGYYYYAYYDDAGHTPTGDADTFWNDMYNPGGTHYISANGNYLDPVIDVEESAAPSNGETLSHWVYDFCQRLTADAAAVGLTITPQIYCNQSFATSDFDSSTSGTGYFPGELRPLWVAQWPSTIPNPQTTYPAGTGVWQTWGFWQYADSGSISGFASPLDLDVFQGNAAEMQDYIVGSGRWSVGTWVQANMDGVISINGDTVARAWNAATANSNSPWNNTYQHVPTGTDGKILGGPVYGNSFWRWDVQFNNGVTGWIPDYRDENNGSDILITATPAAPGSPNPANNAVTNSLPASFTWSAGANDSTYNVYLDGSLKSSGQTATSWAHSAIADGSHTWRVDGLNGGLTATGTTWNFTIDTVAPTASYGGQTPAGGGSVLDFTVNYGDATSGVNASSIGAGDVTVTGPNNFSQVATFKSYSNGVATYEISAPGGIWNAAANGTYTVSQNATQVKDNAGNYRPAGSIGTFIANTFAYLSGTALVIDYGNTAGSMSLSPSGANLLVQQGNNTDTFASSSVSSITVSGSAASDIFNWQGPITQPVTLNLSGGGGTVNVSGGAMPVANDVTSASPGLTLNVASGAEVDFTTSEGLAALSVDGGKVAMNPSASTALTITGVLSLTNAGTLDIGDGQLLTTDATSVLLPYLHSAYDGGKWDGAGLTSGFAAAHPGVGIGYVAGNGSNGAPVGYTLLENALVGDTTLKGSVGLDDYNTLAANFNQAGGWAQGDFDYDGTVTLSDYNLLSGNFNKTFSQVTGSAQQSATPTAQTATTPTATQTTTATPTTTNTSSSHRTRHRR